MDKSSPRLLNLRRLGSSRNPLNLGMLGDGETTIEMKVACLRVVWHGGGEENGAQNAVFLGKRDDNKILKVQIVLSEICCHCAGS